MKQLVVESVEMLGMALAIGGGAAIVASLVIGIISLFLPVDPVRMYFV